MAGKAKIWEIYQEPAYIGDGENVTVLIAVKNAGTADTIWVNAAFDSTVCLDHSSVGVPAGRIFQYWMCRCGSFTPPQVTVHIEAGHGSKNNPPDDVFDYVIVLGASLVAEAGGPYTGEKNIPVQFTGFAQGGVPPYTYLWDFGDGIGTSTEQSPQYAYTDEGQYDAKLTVVDSAMHTIFDCASVQIGPPPRMYNLTVTINPDGWGEVPPFGYHSATREYPEGTIVTLTAYRLVTTKFDRWSGDVESTENPVQVLMDRDKTVYANFIPSGQKICWRCVEIEPGFWQADPGVFPDTVVCGEGEAEGFPYPEEPNCGCTEGATRCIYYDKYVCQDDQWVLLEPQSIECGYNPEYITCYRCPFSGGHAPEQQQFPEPECPEGWYPDIPVCGGEPTQGINWLWIVAVLGGATGIAAALMKKR